MAGAICYLCQELGFPPDINCHPDNNSRFSHAGLHLMHDWNLLPGSKTKEKQLQINDACFLPPKKPIQKRGYEKAFPKEPVREKALEDEQLCTSKRRNLRVLPKKVYEEPATDDESDSDHQQEEAPPENFQISAAEIEEEMGMATENPVPAYKQKQIKKEIQDDLNMEETAKMEESTIQKVDKGLKPIKQEIVQDLPTEGKNNAPGVPAKIEEKLPAKVEEDKKPFIKIEPKQENGQPLVKNIPQRRSRIGLECNLCGTILTINTEIAQWEHVSGNHLQQTPLFHCGKAGCGWSSHRVSHMRDHIKYTHKKQLKRFEANEDVKNILEICFKEKRISSNKCKECSFQCTEEPVQRRREKWVHVVNVHIKEKIIFCNTCKEGFDWVTNAQIHLQNEHPNVNYDENAFEDRRDRHESAYIRCFGLSGLKKAIKSEQPEETKELVEVEGPKEKDETANPDKCQGIAKSGNQQMNKPSSLGSPLSNKATRVYQCNKGCKEQFTSQEQLNRHRDGLLCTKKRANSHLASKC